MAYSKIDYKNWNIHGLYWDTEQRLFKFTLIDKDGSCRVEYCATYIDFLRDNGIHWTASSKAGSDIKHWEILNEHGGRIASGACKASEFTQIYRIEQICEYFGWKSSRKTAHESRSSELILKEAQELTG